MRRWAEAEVAAANARADALERMIEESRGDYLSARICASEDTEVADADGRVFCDYRGESWSDAEMSTTLGKLMKSAMLVMRSRVEARTQR